MQHWGVDVRLSALLALLLLGCAVSQDSPPLDKQQVRNALIETACEYVYSDDDTDTEAFFKRVREKHGVFNFSKCTLMNLPHLIKFSCLFINKKMGGPESYDIV